VLLESGAFDGAHAAMMVHPAPADLAAAASRAVTRIRARFRPAAARAAGFLVAPGALLAVGQAGTLCDVAAGLLNTSAPAGLTVHRVQSAGCWGQRREALIDFAVRGDTLDDIQGAAGRLADCARSAAAAAGCQVTVERFLPYAQLRYDPELTLATGLMRKHAAGSSLTSGLSRISWATPRTWARCPSGCPPSTRSSGSRPPR
jgi:metal-dependent amidase/aminoacylase/carboxypeptidase family protein